MENKIESQTFIFVIFPGPFLVENKIDSQKVFVVELDVNCAFGIVSQHQYGGSVFSKGLQNQNNHYNMNLWVIDVCPPQDSKNDIVG